MKYRTYFVLFLMLVASTFSFGKSKESVGFTTGLLVPFNNNNNQTSMTVGATYHFWGIFDFMGTTYIGLDSEADEFYKIFKAPELYSFGVGISIPMGGFYFKSDSQQFIKLNSGSFSGYFGSYKGGVGFKLDDNVELEFYYRNLYNYDNFFESDNRNSFIGFGIILKD